MKDIEDGKVRIEQFISWPHKVVTNFMKNVEDAKGTYSMLIVSWPQKLDGESENFMTAAFNI